MTDATKNTITEAITEYAENEDLSLRADYSGRFMYGERCIGLVTPSIEATLADLLLYVVDEYDVSRKDAKAVLIDGHRRDNMGMGYIIYWPALHAVEG